MKRILSVVMLLCMGNILHAQDEYSIMGTISDLPDGIKFYLIKSSQTGAADTVSTTSSRNGEFAFKGNVSDPELFFVKMDTSEIKLKEGSASWVRLFLDNSKIILNGKLNEWPVVQIQGSELTKQYDHMAQIIKQQVATTESKNKEIDGDSTGMAINREKLRDTLVNILSLNYDNYATPLFSYNLRRFIGDRTKDIYNSLSENVKNSHYGKKLFSSIRAGATQKKVQQNATLPDFSLKLLNGDSVSIYSLIKNGKVTLIDFWASWCKPCRAEIPNLLKVYEAFHKSGFNIIGISSDDKIQLWKKALSEDKTPWIQTIEGQDYRIGKEIFDLGSIPAYVLVDSNGKLLAFQRGISSVPSFGPKLSGGDLYKVVEDLLKKAARQK